MGLLSPTQTVEALPVMPLPRKMRAEGSKQTWIALQRKKQKKIPGRRCL